MVASSAAVVIGALNLAGIAMIAIALRKRTSLLVKTSKVQTVSGHQ